MSTIQILGAGCAKCKYLATNAERAVQELGRSDVIEKVTDIMKMLEFNPSALPALAINGKVVSAGTLPTPAQIKVFLEASTIQGDAR
jgi:small redox-active disulfide protein 2